MYLAYMLRFFLIGLDARLLSIKLSAADRNRDMTWADMKNMLRQSPCGPAFKLTDVFIPCTSYALEDQLQGFLSMRHGMFVAHVLMSLFDDKLHVSHFITFDSWRQLIFIGGGRSYNGLYVSGVQSISFLAALVCSLCLLA